MGAFLRQLWPFIAPQRGRLVAGALSGLIYALGGSLLLLAVKLVLEAIFPTEGPDTIRYVLEHSESSLLFVGKLDIKPHRNPSSLMRSPIRRLHNPRTSTRNHRVPIFS